MKKAYQKPTLTFMRLRPEERLAQCQWPIGFWSGSSCQQPWADVAIVSSTCMAMYNNSETTGS